MLDSIPDWQLIIGMRNVIVHGHDQLDRRRLAAAISEDLPMLIANLKQVIRPLVELNFGPGDVPRFEFEATPLSAFRDGVV